MVSKASLYTTVIHNYLAIGLTFSWADTLSTGSYIVIPPNLSIGSYRIIGVYHNRPSTFDRNSTGYRLYLPIELSI